MEKIIYKETLEFKIGDKVLSGEKAIPYNAKELVIFFHGISSSSSSKRNQYLANRLNEANYATVLVDLLMIEEDFIFKHSYDNDLFTERLIMLTHEVSSMRGLGLLKIGYFGSGTGTASALNAAAYLGPDMIKAVVSMGGRPDLSLKIFDRMKSPVLLIVGEKDTEMIKLNELVLEKLDTEKKLEIIPGCTNLFDEPGKLDIVANLAIDWFSRHLSMNYTVACPGDMMYPFPWS